MGRINAHTKQEAAEQTRVSLLRAGLDLLREGHGPLDRLQAKDVASHVGRTIGAFHGHWRTQDNFRTSLSEYVLGEQFDPDYQAITYSAEAAHQAGGNGRQAWAGALMGVTVPDPTYKARMHVARSLDNVKDGAIIAAAYYSRQQGHVEASLLQALDLGIEPATSLEIVCASEDFAVRAIREHLTLDQAAIALSRHIPSVQRSE